MKQQAIEAKRDIYEYSIDLRANTAAAKVASLVGREKAVLEVGCGPGSQSRVFRDHLDCRVVGLEIDAQRAVLAREFCAQVHVANVETADLDAVLGSERFDVITCSDVLEHLRDPAGALRRLVPYLKPGGFLLASIPNVTHAALVFEMAHGRFEYRDYGLLDNTHIQFFCRRSVLALFEAAGLVVSELHCVTKAPKDTEFETQTTSGEDAALLDLIQKRNPDALTYQFVLKSYPAVDSEGSTRNAALLGERVRQLEQQLADQVRENRQLRLSLEWVESRAPYRAYRKLKTLLGRG